MGYVRARTVDEALEVLARHGAEARVLAGGTDLVPALKRRQFSVRSLVSIRHIPELRGIRPDGRGGLVVGALTTLAELAEDPRIQAVYPALGEAAAQVATPTIRNMATLGGNLLVDTRCYYYNQSEWWRLAVGNCMKCDPAAPCRVAPGSDRCLAVFSSDTAPALMALGARVRLRSPRGEREIGLGELYREDGMRPTCLEPDELLTAVLLPPPDGWRSTYLKLRRRGSFDFPILGVAAALRLAEDGCVTGARLVLGAAGSAPVVVEEAASLAGGAGQEEALAAVARAARKRARPVDNTDLDVLYRRRMAEVLTVRAFRRLAGGPAAR